MELIVDTNRIVASLIKDGISRKIILSSRFTLHSPEFGVAEVSKYRGMIMEKTHLDEGKFNTLMKMLLSKIIVYSEKEFSGKSLERAEKLMGKIDKDDVLFAALSFELKGTPIWSDDLHFRKQEKIRIYTTKELSGLFEQDRAADG